MPCISTGIAPMAILRGTVLVPQVVLCQTADGIDHGLWHHRRRVELQSWWKI